ncbi:hypothetical protein [Microcoleus sp. AT10-A2]|uniref:hypothetical protein n=1 Tax=Microcoleus sp. AT10-A2 TaxID=2818574 RepID=UPI002FD71149
MSASTIAPGAMSLMVVEPDCTSLTIRNGYPTRSPAAIQTLGKHFTTRIIDRT